MSTAGIIMAASLLGFPVASSHVVGGAVLGAGLAGPSRSISWRIVTEMVFSWVLTLPGAALLAFLLEEVRAQIDANVGLVLILTVAALLVAATLPPRRRHIAGVITPAAVRDGRILFICGGNTSRSPMAAAICNAEILRRLGPNSGLRAISAGLTAEPGVAMTTNAIAALAEIGVPALAHAAAVVDSALVNSAEIIFCMTQSQCLQITSRFPSAASKVFRLCADGDIADPAGGDPVTFRDLAKILTELMALRMTEIVRLAAG
jgi:protein-tyrosine-phosphatase